MEARSIESYSVQTDEGVSSLDRFAVRDRIRRREVGPETKVARAGSEVWVPASEISELKRYFDLLELTEPRGARGPTSVRGPARATFAGRILPSLRYPFTGAGPVVLPVLAVLMTGLAGLVMVPLSGMYRRGAIYLLAAVLCGLVVSTLLQVVRHTARGEMEFPTIEVEDWSEMPALFLRTTGLAILAAWPVLLAWAGYVWVGYPSSLDNLSLKTTFPGVLLSLLFVHVYHPVCVAVVAVWENYHEPLNPFFVARTARILGGDYVRFTLVAMVGTGLVIAASGPLGRLSSPALRGFLLSALGLWLAVSVAHLLGFMVHEHEEALGWE